MNYGDLDCVPPLTRLEKNLGRTARHSDLNEHEYEEQCDFEDWLVKDVESPGDADHVKDEMDTQWEILKSMVPGYVEPENRNVTKTQVANQPTKQRRKLQDIEEYCHVCHTRCFARIPQRCPHCGAVGALSIAPASQQAPTGNCWAFSSPVDVQDVKPKFGGFLCPVTSKEFLEEADRIRATCVAERAAQEACEGRDVRTLVADKPANEINKVSHQMDGGWQLMSMAVDSGAAETVIPHNLVTQYPIWATKESAAGLCYASATGQPIPNLGEQKLPLYTKEGTLRGMTFQAAPVSKPLGSVKRMCAAGHRVVFDEEGSFIQNKASGEINWLREEEGNYVLDVWIVPPEAVPQQPGEGFGWQP